MSNAEHVAYWNGKAAFQHLPWPEPAPPNAPGPFAFADADSTRSALQGAGFSAGKIRLPGAVWLVTAHKS